MILTKLDYAILAFIGSYDEIHEGKVFEKFPEDKYSTRYRLQLLSKSEYNHLNNTHVPNTGLITYKYNQPSNSNLRATYTNKTDICYITDLGKKALQDYNFENAENERLYKENEIRYKETAAAARRSNHIAISAVVISTLTAIATFFRN